MQSVVKELERRLVEAQADRLGTLLDLSERHYDRNNLGGAVDVAMEVIAGCGQDPGRRSDALRVIARAFGACDAPDHAAEAATRAVLDAMAAADPGREARARDIHGHLLLRAGNHRAARDEFRMAGVRHRFERDTLAMKRTAMQIADTYRQQGIAAETHHPEHARTYLKQSLRAYRVAAATGESAANDAAIAAAAADCECRLGNFGLAQVQVDRALALLPQVHDSAVAVEIHLAECRLHRVTGDLRAAEWAGERACSAARSRHDNALARGLQALSAVHDAQARFERASDMEMRAREILMQRHQALLALRDDLLAMWRRGSAGAPAAACNAA